MIPETNSPVFFPPVNVSEYICGMFRNRATATVTAVIFQAPGSFLNEAAKKTSRTMGAISRKSVWSCMPTPSATPASAAQAGFAFRPFPATLDSE